MDKIVNSFWFTGLSQWIGFALFVLLCIIVGIWFLRDHHRRLIKLHETQTPLSTLRALNWRDFPETQLVVLTLPLHLLWEIAQFPLFTVWHEGSWSYILYGLVHCTLGDLLIMLSVFWLVALLNRSRYWAEKSALLNIILFTVLGLVYTIYSEIINTRINETWGYTELMPIVPGVEIGGMPFLQWVLVPPITLWLMRLLKQRQAV